MNNKQGLINYNKLLIIPYLLLVMFVFTQRIYAASATYMSDDVELNVLETKSITLFLDNVNGSIIASGGTIGVNDSTCIEIVNIKSLNPFTNVNDKKFAYFNITGGSIKTKTDMVSVTIKGLKGCDGRLTLSGANVADVEGKTTASVSMGKISILNRQSSNSNLKSLSISNHTISPSFQSSVDSYNVNVPSSVTSINIDAVAEDSKSKIKINGNSTLEIGLNKYTIVVESEDGSTKNYYLNVTRASESKNEKSNNATLKNLSVNIGSLVPSFSSNIKNYTISVPYSTKSINVNANCSDAKSKVSISGNTNLIVGQNTVSIKVTAENGTTEIYNIYVTRKKESSSSQSSNNNLASLVPSSGQLSPSFDKSILNYTLNVPYDVASISFEKTLEDKKSVIEEETVDILSIGKNVFKYIVIAENGDSKTYVIIVNRNNDPKMESSANSFLKSITILNGKLNKRFTDNNFKYKYSTNNNEEIKYKYEISDSSSKVFEVKEEDTIYLIVESSSGLRNIYVLEKDSYDISTLLMAILSTLFLINILLIVIYFKNIGKRKKKKTKEK